MAELDGDLAVLSPLMRPHNTGSSVGDFDASSSSSSFDFAGVELVIATAFFLRCCSKRSRRGLDGDRVLRQLPNEPGSHDVQARLASLQEHVAVWAHLFRGPHEQHGSLRADMFLSSRRVRLAAGAADSCEDWDNPRSSEELLASSPFVVL